MTFTRVATLTEDAIEFEESVQLSYKSLKNPSAFSGPPKAICPPLESLKKGTKVRITYEGRPLRGTRMGLTMGCKVIKVELV